MGDRGYTLIDFRLPPVLAADRDRQLRFLEYVRANFLRLVPTLPRECEVDIFASGHAHSVGLLPLLGVFALEGAIARVPDPDSIIRTIDDWAAALTEYEVLSITETTAAPTWAELQRLGVHPVRKRRNP